MRLALLALLVQSIVLQAQSWCPPGASWTHTLADQAFGGGQGVTRVEYEGDTTVNGYTVQMLRETNVIAPWGSTNYTSTTSSIPLFTHYADGVVYVWNAWPEQVDTLMWFSASPGQFWSGPDMDNDPYSRLTVLDTSTVVIDGVPLRQLLIERSLWEWAPPDTLRERIGFSFNYLNGWSWFVTDQPWAGLRCYQDAQIGYSTPGTTDCSFTLNVEDAEKGISVAAFPNPGASYFTLSLSIGTHTITLFDATGRMVHQQRTTEARPVIDTEALPTGLYRITVQNGVGSVDATTWVKAW